MTFFKDVGVSMCIFFPALYNMNFNAGWWLQPHTVMFYRMSVNYVKP